MCRLTVGHPWVTIGHLRATMGHLRLTIGYPKATVAHVRETLGHLRVTLSHLRVTLGHLRVSNHKANTTDRHPKVRQTCFNTVVWWYQNVVKCFHTKLTIYQACVVVLRKCFGWSKDDFRMTRYCLSKNILI